MPIVVDSRDGEVDRGCKNEPIKSGGCEECCEAEAGCGEEQSIVAARGGGSSGHSAGLGV